MTAPASIPGKKLADLIHGSHRGEPAAIAELRAWSAAHPEEASNAARRSWKMGAFLQAQGLIDKGKT